LNNARRHAPPTVTFRPDWIDPLSSAAFFDGWSRRPRLYQAAPGEGEPTAAPGTWLLSTGWRFLGLIAPDEVPGLPS
jgi:REP-associated tyrosine transposase